MSVVRKVELYKFKKWLQRTLRNVAKRYIEAGGDRDHVYLSVLIMSDDQDPSHIHISFNNEYWAKSEDTGRDVDFPINEWEDVKLVDGKWQEVKDE